MKIGICTHLDLRFDDAVDPAWRTLLFNSDSLRADVSGAVAIDGDLLGVRFRLDSHPLLYAVELTRIGSVGRVTLRFSERVLFPNGISDILVRSQGSNVDCELLTDFSVDAQDLVELSCDSLFGGVGSVELSDATTTVIGGHVYGAADVTPAVAHWTGSDADLGVAERRTFRQFDARFATSRVRWE